MTGIVQRITYQNKENGYCVLKIKPTQDSTRQLFDVENDADQLITVTGSLLMLKEGDEVDFLGEFKEHEKYGTFLDVQKFHIHPPSSVAGLEKFLANDHFKGIGPKTAEKLVDKFGEQLPQVIENEPDQLAKIKGITRQKATEIHEAWIKAQSIRDEMIALQGMGLTPLVAQKVITEYAEDAVQKVRENPYQLAQDIWGVGFAKADQIAQEIGFEHDHPYRIQSGLYYTLLSALDDGHMYLPREELVDAAQKILGLNQQEVVAQLDFSIKEGALIEITDQSDSPVYIKKYYEYEQELAQLLVKLKECKEHSLDEVEEKDIDRFLATQEDEQHLQLNSAQLNAIKSVFSNTVTILTGGPGTGKTTTVDTLIRILHEQGATVALAAPTGRAAKRLEELTGYPAQTLHRLLKLKPNEIAGFNQTNPLPYDVVVVDEVSMLDTFLALNLIRAIKPGTHLLLVGDADQLPSVQAGNVLHDLIASNQFRTIKLTEIFRQAQDSAIIRNAHRIQHGQFPELPAHPTDFYLFNHDDIGEVAEQIVELVTSRIPKQFKYDPRNEIQVMAPLYKTKAGVTELNAQLQAKLNPKSNQKNEVKLSFQTLREGDRVMQLRNNYEKEVFNGDIGTVVGIENKDNIKLTVEFADLGNVEYKNEQVRELTLAYAVSVHKSQGSEYPVVVMPIITSHYIMLQRNLLYTGVTRARKLVILVGTKKAIYIALNNDKPQHRYTGLTQLIQTHSSA